MADPNKNVVFINRNWFLHARERGREKGRAKKNLNGNDQTSKA